MDHTLYDNPLIARYASKQMSELWGPQRKFSTWRRLWIALAEAEAELGLAVAPQQIAELENMSTTSISRRPSGTSGGCGTTSWLTSMPMATSARPPGRSSTSARQAAT